MKYSGMPSREYRSTFCSASSVMFCTVIFIFVAIAGLLLVSAVLFNVNHKDHRASARARLVG